MNKCLPFLFGLLSVSCKPLTCPDVGVWNYAVSLQNGVESNYSYTIASEPFTVALPLATFYKIRTTQSAGYSSWIYLFSRLAYSVSFAGVDLSYGRLRKHDFFDYDISLVFPVRLPSRYPLTLQPQIGLAYMRETLLRRSIADGVVSRLVTSYTAPLIGLILGFEPNRWVSLRSGLNLQFPKAQKYAQSQSSHGPKESLTAARHAIYFFFDATFQLSRHFELAVSAERTGYSVQSLRSPADNFFISNNAAANRTALTLGGQWTF